MFRACKFSAGPSSRPPGCGSLALQCSIRCGGSHKVSASDSEHGRVDGVGTAEPKGPGHPSPRAGGSARDDRGPAARGLPHRRHHPAADGGLHRRRDGQNRRGAVRHHPRAQGLALQEQGLEPEPRLPTAGPVLPGLDPGRPRHGRRGRIGLAHPGAGPFRHLPGHLGPGPDQPVRHQPRRPDPRQGDQGPQRGVRAGQHGPRRPLPPRPAPDLRPRRLRGRTGPGHHPGGGGLPQRGVRAPAVRPPHRHRPHHPGGAGPPADQQVLLHGHGAGPQPGRVRIQAGPPDVRDQLAQSHRRAPWLEPRHLRGRHGGGAAGGGRDHRHRPGQHHLPLCRWDHHGRACSATWPPSATTWSTAPPSPSPSSTSPCPP